MTLDQAVALSLAPTLRRPGLTERLRANDPELLEQAAPLLDPRARGSHARRVAAGVEALAWNDPRFPTALLAIPDVPPVLWYRGILECVRRAGRGDCRVARGVGRGARNGRSSRGRPCGARHRRRQRPRTRCRFGRASRRARHAAARSPCSALVSSASIQPSTRAWRVDIARTGLVMSEYAPGTPPLPFHFPLRNRLISGLSRAVVVIEASDKSGSLITAGCALEQGRDVMAVPGNVLSGRNRGGHALIRDGATIVESADDIVEELGLAPGSPHREAAEASRHESTDLHRSGPPAHGARHALRPGRVWRACPASMRESVVAPPARPRTAGTASAASRAAVSSARCERASVVEDNDGWRNHSSSSSRLRRRRRWAASSGASTGSRRASATSAICPNRPPTCRRKSRRRTGAASASTSTATSRRTTSSRRQEEAGRAPEDGDEGRVGDPARHRP